MKLDKEFILGHIIGSVFGASIAYLFIKYLIMP